MMINIMQNNVLVTSWTSWYYHHEHHDIMIMNIMTKNIMFTNIILKKQVEQAKVQGWNRLFNSYYIIKFSHF